MNHVIKHGFSSLALLLNTFLGSKLLLTGT